MDPASLSFAEPGRFPWAVGKVRVRWLGTAGFAIAAEGHELLIDPYLTRAPLRTCVTSRLTSDEMVLARTIPRADAIVVGHTHFDHALDVPAIARRTGAIVFGSRSAIALCRGQGVPEAQLRDVEPTPGGPPVVAELGPYRLRFFPSAHSRLVLGRVPFPGDIEDCDEVPLRATQYRCGAVFGVEIRVGGRVLHHVGSAELVEAGLPRDAAGVDLALACVAGWTKSPRYPERLVRALAPRAVLLSHWDDFLRPLSAPARALPLMRLPKLVERFAAADRQLAIGTLPLLGDVTL